MKNKKTLFLKDIKLRTQKTEDGKKYLIGLIPYNKEGQDLTERYKEVITNTAFNQSLNSKRRIVALKNHNDDFPLGNTETGTLTLNSTNEGLECKCELPETTFANDLIISVERGDCTGMSFGFIPIKEEEKDGVYYLREVKLLEVSYGVVFPFYSDAAAAVDLRSALKDIQHLVKRGENMDEQTLNMLKQLVSDLQKIIQEQEGDNAEDDNSSQLEKNKADNSPKPEDESSKADEEKEKEKEEKERSIQTKKERAKLLKRLQLIAI